MAAREDIKHRHHSYSFLAPCTRHGASDTRVFKSVDLINDGLPQAVMPIEKAGDKRRIRYERASGVGDVRYCHVSGEWNDATTVTARINQSDSPAKEEMEKLQRFTGSTSTPAAGQVARLVAWWLTLCIRG